MRPRRAPAIRAASTRSCGSATSAARVELVRRPVQQADLDGAWLVVAATGDPVVTPPIGTVADKHGVSKAQVALAWLLAQGEDIVPIPGTKRRATMEDSVAAADVTLTAADLAAIDAAAPVGGTSGPRYGEMGMRMVRL